MKKFLKIYDDSESRYVAINADEVRFIGTTNELLQIYFNAKETDADQVKVRFSSVSSDVENKIKATVIDAYQKLMCKSYSKATIDINLPVSVTEIEVN